MTDNNDAISALQLWGRTEIPVRELSGLNKDTWKVGASHWLAADNPTAADMWFNVAELLRQPELGYLDLPRVVPSTSGDLFPHFQRRLWRLTTSVEGTVPVASSADNLESVAAGLAHLHRALAQLPQKFGAYATPAQTVIKRAHDLVNGAQLPFTGEEITVIFTGLRLLQDAGVVDDQHQLIHGDPSYPNLRLGKSGVLSGVIDWEAVRWDTPLVDLAVVGQTVLYRSGWADLRVGLQRLLDKYAGAGGRVFSVCQLLVSILGIKFGSIAHHGQKLVDGAGDAELVRSQAEKIKIVCRLLRDEPKHST